MLLAPIRSFRVCISHQSDRRIRVCISHQWERRFCSLVFERCSNFNELTRNSERAVRKIESLLKMRNVGQCFPQSPYHAHGACILTITKAIPEVASRWISHAKPFVILWRQKCVKISKPVSSKIPVHSTHSYAISITTCTALCINYNDFVMNKGCQFEHGTEQVTWWQWFWLILSQRITGYSDLLVKFSPV